MTAPVDHVLFARQMALPEVGAAGQQRLATTPVDLRAWPPLTASLYVRAGGLVVAGSADDPEAIQGASPGALTVEAPVPSPDLAGPMGLGVAAWGAVEAARRVLGEPSREIPPALRAWLEAP